MVRLSYPFLLMASVMQETRAMKKLMVTKRKEETGMCNKKNKEKHTSMALIRNIPEPINVLLSFPALYFPIGHLFPVKAARGSQMASMTMGR
jgi:hypothetical protein